MMITVLYTRFFSLVGGGPYRPQCREPLWSCLIKSWPAWYIGQRFVSTTSEPRCAWLPSFDLNSSIEQKPLPQSSLSHRRSQRYQSEWFSGYGEGQRSLSEYWGSRMRPDFFLNLRLKPVHFGGLNVTLQFLCYHTTQSTSAVVSSRVNQILSPILCRSNKWPWRQAAGRTFSQRHFPSP